MGLLSLGSLELQDMSGHNKSKEVSLTIRCFPHLIEKVWKTEFPFLGWRRHREDGPAVFYISLRDGFLRSHHFYLMGMSYEEEAFEEFRVVHVR